MYQIIGYPIDARRFWPWKLSLGVAIAQRGRSISRSQALLPRVDKTAVFKAEM